jgi:hypothetical protein
MKWIIACVLLAGLPFGRALAQEPEVELRAKPEPAKEQAQSAEAKAEQWRARLYLYKQMGGAAYKGGLVRMAEDELARYTRLAAEEAGGGALTSASPCSEERKLAELYREMGGAAYRARLVEEADAKVLECEAPLNTETTEAPQRLYHEVAPFKPWLN